MIKIVAIIVVLVSINCHAMGSKKWCDKVKELPWCAPSAPPVPTPEPQPEPPVPVPDPQPEPQPPVSDFDWSKVSKWGGSEIPINKNVANWEVTQTLESVEVKGGHLYSKRTGPNFEPCFGGEKKLQGTFNALVKQSDGSYIAGSWDFERCGGQSKKILSNLDAGGTMATSFGLQKGSEICFFMSCNARNNQKNCEKRSTIKCTKWE